MLHFHNHFGCSGSNDDVHCRVSSVKILVGYTNSRSVYARCNVSTIFGFLCILFRAPALLLIEKKIHVMTAVSKRNMHICKYEFVLIQIINLIINTNNQYIDKSNKHVLQNQE